MPDSANMMKGVVLHGHGGLDMLEYRDNLPVPQPQAGDVLLEPCLNEAGCTALDSGVFSS